MEGSERRWRSQNPISLLLDGLKPRRNRGRASSAQPRDEFRLKLRTGASGESGAVGRPPGDGPAAPNPAYGEDLVVDLERRRDQLTGRFAELQWDLGGLVYEMAIRNRIRVDVLVHRAAALQDADAELSEVERIVRMEQTGTAGTCGSCGAPHSSGAAYCWQCGSPLLQQVSGRGDPEGLIGAAHPKRPVDVIAGAGIGGLLEDLLGVVALDQRSRPARRRSRSRLKNAVWSATRAACCMLCVTITIV